MEEKTGFINDFVEIETRIVDSREPIETTEYTGIQDLFESHLPETLNDINNLQQYGIDVYRIKIGDILRISPSKWTSKFCEEKGLEVGDDYDISYEVVNFIVDYYSKHPNNDSGLPLLKMIIELTRT